MQTSKKELVAVFGIFVFCFFMVKIGKHRIQEREDYVKKGERERKNRLALRGEVCLIHRVAFRLCYQANIQKARPDTELKCASVVV